MNSTDIAKKNGITVKAAAQRCYRLHRRELEILKNENTVGYAELGKESKKRGIPMAVLFDMKSHIHALW